MFSYLQQQQLSRPVSQTFAPVWPLGSRCASQPVRSSGRRTWPKPSPPPRSAGTSGRWRASRRSRWPCWTSSLRPFEGTWPRSSVPRSWPWWPSRCTPVTSSRSWSRRAATTSMLSTGWASFESTGTRWVEEGLGMEMIQSGKSWKCSFRAQTLPVMFQRAGLLSGTKEPGAMLSRVQVPGVARDFCPRVNFQRRLSDGVCTVTCINICISDISMCVHTKMSTLVATPLFGHVKILYVLVGMVSVQLHASASASLTSACACTLKCPHW